MWFARDLKFGGHRQRYANGGRRAVRSVDPFTAELRQFETTLQDDNFLLRNYAPHAKLCLVPKGGLAYFYLGHTWTAKCHLLTRFDDGVGVVDLVAVGLTPRVEQQWAELQRVAPTFGLVPQLRTASEIRSNLTLLRNLGHVHQHLVLYATEHPCLEEAIRDALPNQGTVRLAELQQEARHLFADAAAFEGSLFRLYRRGQVSLNLSEVTYGFHTTVGHA